MYQAWLLLPLCYALSLWRDIYLAILCRAQAIQNNEYSIHGEVIEWHSSLRDMAASVTPTLAIVQTRTAYVV